MIIDYNDLKKSTEKIARKFSISRVVSEVLKSIPAPYLIEPIARVKLRKYSDELKVWSEYSKYIGTANISYELDGMVGGKLSLCSSMSMGSRHFRNLDWDIKGLKKWIVFDCINAPAGKFKMVGVPGMVGCLTGCAKGRFSISVNADLTECSTSLTGIPIGVLVRQALEECYTAKEAVNFLMSKRPMRSSFVHIVSTSGNYIVHAQKRPACIRKNAVTNHDPRFEFEYENGDECYEDSLKRLKMLNRPSNMLKYPVYSDITMQCVVMDSKTGEIKRNG